jgi:hypothetical protein
MAKNEVERIAIELETRGYCRTFFGLLGLSLDPDLTGRICDQAALGTFGESAAKLTEHVTKSDMAMIRDRDLRHMGHMLMNPVIEALFAPAQPTNWELYTVNRYDTVGATLGSHQDHIGTTVLIATVHGSRQLDILNTPEPDVFDGVKESFTLATGSIMIMDPEADPGHAITCLEAPSISVVAGIPELIRNSQKP